MLELACISLTFIIIRRVIEAKCMWWVLCKSEEGLYFWHDFGDEIFDRFRRIDDKRIDEKSIAMCEYVWDI